MPNLAQKIIAIDSMILIYLLEKHPKYWERVATILNEAQQIHVSSLVYGEVLTGLYLKKDQEAIEKFLTFMTLMPKIIIHPFDSPQSIHFAQLRASSPALPAPDCIHLATAILSNAEIFLTNDRQIKSTKRVKVAQLEDLL